MKGKGGSKHPRRLWHSYFVAHQICRRMTVIRLTQSCCLIKRCPFPMQEKNHAISICLGRSQWGLFSCAFETAGLGRQRQAGKDVLTQRRRCGMDGGICLGLRFAGAVFHASRQTGSWHFFQMTTAMAQPSAKSSPDILNDLLPPVAREQRAKQAGPECSKAKEENYCCKDRCQGHAART